MKVTGVAEAKSNKFDKYSVLVNGTWYSSKFEIPCEKGDTVEFDDGGRKYCQKLRVVIEGGSSTGKSSSGNSDLGVSKDRCIVRQNALSHATSIVCMTGVADVETTANMTVEVAKIFEGYAMGDDEKDVAKLETNPGDFVEP